MEVVGSRPIVCVCNLPKKKKENKDSSQLAEKRLFIYLLFQKWIGFVVEL